MQNFNRLIIDITAFYIGEALWKIRQRIYFYIAAHAVRSAEFADDYLLSVADFNDFSVLYHNFAVHNFRHFVADFNGEDMVHRSLNDFRTETEMFHVSDILRQFVAQFQTFCLVDFHTLYDCRHLLRIVLFVFFNEFFL